MKRSGPIRRKEPMKRSSAQLRRTAIKRGSSQLDRSTPIKARSAKRAKIMATERAPLVKALILAGVRCEVCPRIDAAGYAVKCTGAVQGIHERRKRSAGGSLLVAANLIPSCNWGNGWVEDNPTFAFDMGTGLVVRSDAEEWESLGVRADPVPVEVLTCPRCGTAYVTLHTACG